MPKPSLRTWTGLMQTPEQIHFHEHTEETEVVTPNCDIPESNTYIRLHIVCKKAAAFKNNSGAGWLFWGSGFLQLGQKTDFIKLFVQPGHREAVTHKYLPRVVYNPAPVSCTPISAAEYIHSVKAWSLERRSLQRFKQPVFKVFLFRLHCSWPLVEEGTQSKQEAFGTFKAT